MSWYTNPWVVGIIGSVPGGFLVNWITGLVLRKKENREYLQKVIGANREVVYAIRPGISEGEIPSSDVLNALRNATARRYGVEASDLYSASEIAEELTKEVMDSSFISSSQKQEYCLRLSELVAASQKLPSEDTLDKGAKRTVTAEYQDRFISTMGTLLGVLTVTITAMISILEFLRTKDFGSVFRQKDGKGLEFFVPLIATGATLAATTAVLPLLREFSKRKSRDEETTMEDALGIVIREPRTAKSAVERKPSSAEKP